MAKNSLRRTMRQNLSDMRYAKSQAQYMQNVDKFAAFCHDNNLGTKAVLQDPAAAVQQWVDSMVAAGKSSSTIHSYAAAACHGLKISMTQVTTPARTIDTKTKSLGYNARAAREAANSDNARLVDFANKVGIRRNEYAQLRGNDCKVDESGHWCVVVRKGKGGKYQLQRIAPDDVDFVRGYFDGSSDKVFSAREMNNQIDLHGIRAQHARAEYNRYLDELAASPDARATLQGELIERFKAYDKAYNVCISNGQYKQAQWHLDQYMGEIGANGRIVYTTRGANRDTAEGHGRPIEYDKTAMMAVSVFCLSHWRNEVTVKHYFV